MTFKHKLTNIIQKNNSLLCIGLDPDMDKIPQYLLDKNNSLFEFNKQIIDETFDLVCAYKPNIAFYESNGIQGLKELKKTIEYLKKNYPEIPIVLDAKRGDIGNTAKMYAKAVFNEWGVDAVTLNPYLGFDALEPFLEYREKGIIVICRSSNKGASDFQDLTLNKHPLYIEVAKKVIDWDKTYKNCFMVIGATWPEELKKVRKLTPHMFFLIPGIGNQGGDIEKTIEAGLTQDKSGLIINISRSILYASSDKDFAQKAREKAQEIKDMINKYR